MKWLGGTLCEKRVRYLDVPNKIEQNWTYTGYKSLWRCGVWRGTECLEGGGYMDGSHLFFSAASHTRAVGSQRAFSFGEQLTFHHILFFPSHSQNLSSWWIFGNRNASMLSLFIQEKNSPDEILPLDWMQGVNEEWQLFQNQECLD